MTSDDEEDPEEPSMAELLPGRVPHRLEALELTVYVEPPLTMELVEHDAGHARKHGCSCSTLVYGADVLVEEDRHYRVMRAYHEAACPYSLRIERRGPFS